MLQPTDLLIISNTFSPCFYILLNMYFGAFSGAEAYLFQSVFCRPLADSSHIKTTLTAVVFLCEGRVRNRIEGLVLKKESPLDSDEVFFWEREVLTPDIFLLRCVDGGQRRGIRDCGCHGNKSRFQ